MYATRTGPFRVESGRLRFQGDRIAEFTLGYLHTCGSQGYGLSGYVPPVDYTVSGDVISFTGSTGVPMAAITEARLSGNTISFRYTTEHGYSFTVRHARQ
ncbi:MAG: hypothetical protein ABR499_05745 [Gemmatimonadaceae bacterium]